MTAKNENKNYLMNNFTKETNGNNPNSVSKNANSAYLNTIQNKQDRMEMSAKAGKPNLLNIIKSNLRGKNSFENLNNLNKHNNVNFQNFNVNSNVHALNHAQNYTSNSGLNVVGTAQIRNQSNEHNPSGTAYNSNYPIMTKSNSVAKDNKQFSALNNNSNYVIINNNYNKFDNKNYNSNKINNLNYINNTKTKENLSNGAGYLNSEGNANLSYGINRQNSSSIRGSSINPTSKGNSGIQSNPDSTFQAQYADNINKSNLEILQRNLKGLNNNIISNNANYTNDNTNFQILSAKRENYLQHQQHNLIKSERTLKSFSPNIKLESAFVSEQKKKLLMKNSVKYFSNNNNVISQGNFTPIAHERGANANNISAINNNINNVNNRINYEDRVVHTDSSAASHNHRRINNLPLATSNNNLLSPNTHGNGNKNLPVNSNKAAAIIINTNLNNNNNNNQTQNNLNILNSPSNKNNINNNSNNNNNNPNKEGCGKPQLIDIMKLISTNQPPISLNVLNKKFENFENSKYSTKRLKFIKGYSANTHQGTVR